VSSRVSCSKTEEAMECRIAAWKNWSWIVTWSVSAPFWITGVVDMRRDPSGGKLGRGVGLYTCLILLLLAWAFFTYQWFWTVFGIEIVSVDQDRLTIKRQLFRLGRSRSFDVRRLHSLGLRGPFGPPNVWRISLQGRLSPDDWARFSCRGTVAFEYDRGTVLFGPHLTEEEATSLTEALRSYLPKSVSDVEPTV
jgi:hypothetical protein